MSWWESERGRAVRGDLRVTLCRLRRGTKVKQDRDIGKFGRVEEHEH